MFKLSLSNQAWQALDNSGLLKDLHFTPSETSTGINLEFSDFDTKAFTTRFQSLSQSGFFYDADSTPRNGNDFYLPAADKQTAVTAKRANQSIGDHLIYWNPGKLKGKFQGLIDSKLGTDKHPVAQIIDLLDTGGTPIHFQDTDNNPGTMGPEFLFLPDDAYQTITAQLTPAPAAPDASASASPAKLDAGSQPAAPAAPPVTTVPVVPFTPVAITLPGNYETIHNSGLLDDITATHQEDLAKNEVTLTFISETDFLNFGANFKSETSFKVGDNVFLLSTEFDSVIDAIHNVTWGPNAEKKDGGVVWNTIPSGAALDFLTAEVSKAGSAPEKAGDLGPWKERLEQNVRSRFKKTEKWYDKDGDFSTKADFYSLPLQIYDRIIDQNKEEFKKTPLVRTTPYGKQPLINKWEQGQELDYVTYQTVLVNETTGLIVTRNNQDARGGARNFSYSEIKPGIYPIPSGYRPPNRAELRAYFKSGNFFPNGVNADLDNLDQSTISISKSKSGKYYPIIGFFEAKTCTYEEGMATSPLLDVTFTDKEMFAMAAHLKISKNGLVDQELCVAKDKSEDGVKRYRLKYPPSIANVVSGLRELIQQTPADKIQLADGRELSKTLAIKIADALDKLPRVGRFDWDDVLDVLKSIGGVALSLLAEAKTSLIFVVGMYWLYRRQKRDERNIEEIKEDNKAERIRENIKEESTKGVHWLDKYAKPLTKLAREGKIKPAIGRFREIDEGLDILGRRKNSNPLFVGDAGTGKTEIANSIACHLKDDPHVEVWEVDMASLLAGTQYRGMFEERFKGVIDLAKAVKEGDPVALKIFRAMEENIEAAKADAADHFRETGIRVILFIDEIHTIVGAGDSEGALDASNILKPPMASGEVSIIGATTPDEVKRILKDPALARRFQIIHVKPPNKKQTLDILKGILADYEAHHKVKYSEEVLKRIMEATWGKGQPAAAISLLDTAGSHANNHRVQNSVPDNTPAEVTLEMVDGIVDRGGIDEEIRDATGRLEALKGEKKWLLEALKNRPTGKEWKYPGQTDDETRGWEGAFLGLDIYRNAGNVRMITNTATQAVVRADDHLDQLEQEAHKIEAEVKILRGMKTEAPESEINNKRPEIRDIIEKIEISTRKLEIVTKGGGAEAREISPVVITSTIRPAVDGYDLNLGGSSYSLLVGESIPQLVERHKQTLAGIEAELAKYDAPKPAPQGEEEAPEKKGGIRQEIAEALMEQQRYLERAKPPTNRPAGGTSWELTAVKAAELNLQAHAFDLQAIPVQADIPAEFQIPSMPDRNADAFATLIRAIRERIKKGTKELEERWEAAISDEAERLIQTDLKALPAVKKFVEARQEAESKPDKNMPAYPEEVLNQARSNTTTLPPKPMHPLAKEIVRIYRQVAVAAQGDPNARYVPPVHSGDIAVPNTDISPLITQGALELDPDFEKRLTAERDEIKSKLTVLNSLRDKLGEYIGLQELYLDRIENFDSRQLTPLEKVRQEQEARKLSLLDFKSKVKLPSELAVDMNGKTPKDGLEKVEAGIALLTGAIQKWDARTADMKEIKRLEESLKLARKGGRKNRDLKTSDVKTSVADLWKEYGPVSEEVKERHAADLAEMKQDLQKRLDIYASESKDVPSIRGTLARLIMKQREWVAKQKAPTFSTTGQSSWELSSAEQADCERIASEVELDGNMNLPDNAKVPKVLQIPAMTEIRDRELYLKRLESVDSKIDGAILEEENRWEAAYVNEAHKLVYQDSPEPAEDVSEFRKTETAQKPGRALDHYPLSVREAARENVWGAHADLLPPEVPEPVSAPERTPPPLPELTIQDTWDELAKKAATDSPLNLGEALTLHFVPQIMLDQAFIERGVLDIFQEIAEYSSSAETISYLRSQAISALNGEEDVVDARVAIFAGDPVKEAIVYLKIIIHPKESIEPDNSFVAGTEGIISNLTKHPKTAPLKLRDALQVMFRTSDDVRLVDALEAIQKATKDSDILTELYKRAMDSLGVRSKKVMEDRIKKWTRTPLAQKAPAVSEAMYLMQAIEQRVDPLSHRDLRFLLQSRCAVLGRLTGNNSNPSPSGGPTGGGAPRGPGGSEGDSSVDELAARRGGGSGGGKAAGPTGTSASAQVAVAMQLDGVELTGVARGIVGGNFPVAWELRPGNFIPDEGPKVVFLRGAGKQNNAALAQALNLRGIAVVLYQRSQDLPAHELAALQEAVLLNVAGYFGVAADQIQLDDAAELTCASRFEVVRGGLSFVRPPNAEALMKEVGITTAERAVAPKGTLGRLLLLKLELAEAREPGKYEGLIRELVVLEQLMKDDLLKDRRLAEFIDGYLGGNANARRTAVEFVTGQEAAQRVMRRDMQETARLVRELDQAKVRERERDKERDRMERLEGK